MYFKHCFGVVIVDIFQFPVAQKFTETGKHVHTSHFNVENVFAVNVLLAVCCSVSWNETELGSYLYSSADRLIILMSKQRWADCVCGPMKS